MASRVPVAQVCSHGSYGVPNQALAFVDVVDFVNLVDIAAWSRWRMRGMPS